MDLRDYIKKPITKIVIVIVLVFVAFYMMWLFPVEHALNKHFNAKKIETLLNTTSDFDANIDHLSYKTNPDFSVILEVEKIQVQDKVSDIISAKNLVVEINPFQILINKLNFSFNAQELNLRITKDKDGTFNILKLFTKEKKSFDKFKINKLSFNINNYKIFYLDEKIGTLVKFKGKNLYLSDYQIGKNIGIKTSGKMYVANKVNKLIENANYDIQFNSKLPIRKNLNHKDFDLNIKINSLNLKPLTGFSDYIKTSDVINIEGLINTDIKTVIDETTQIKKVVGKIYTQDILLKEKLPENTTYLKEKTVIDIVACLLKDSISIEKIELKNLYNNINITGYIKHLTASKPNLDLKLKFHNEIKSMMYWSIPSEWNFEQNIITKIKKYHPMATLDGEILLTGDYLMPDIVGQITSNNFYVDLPIAKEAKAKLKILFNKKRMSIIGEVTPNKDATVYVDGSLNIYGEKNSIFTVKAEKNVKLTVVRAILLPIQDLFRLNFGILNHIFIDGGYGTANLEISGTRKNSIVNGVLNFSNAKASLDGLTVVLENADGNLNFKGKNLDFETTRATTNNSPVKLKGVADLAGNYDIQVSSEQIDTEYILNSLKNSVLLKNILKDFDTLAKIKKIEGAAGLDINVKGSTSGKKVLDTNKINYEGKLKLKKNKLHLNELPYAIDINSANLSFKNDIIKAIVNAKVINSPFNIDVILNDKLHINAISEKFLLIDLMSLADLEKRYSKLISQIKNQSFLKFTASYNGDKKEFQKDKFKLNAQLLSDGIAPFYTSQGILSLENSNAKIENLNLNLMDAKIIVDGSINNVFDKKPDYNLDCDLQNFDIASFNNVANYKVISEDIRKILSAYKDYKGKISGKLNFVKSNIKGKLFLNDIGVVHKKMQLPISISNFSVNFNGQTISIPTIHGMVDDIPVLIKLDILDIFEHPIYDGYITTNLNSSFVNKYINPNLGYPVKLKGEMQFKSYFNGNSNGLKTTSFLNFPVQSDISYMGASLDDKEFEREIKLEMTLFKENLKINKAVFSKYIRSQNGIRSKYPYVTANGAIKLKNDDLEFNNLNIKTQKATNSKIFNILFKKSILKYGKFDCNLNINGTYSHPKILGYINFKNLDMPLYETLIKDIFADFKQNTIDMKVLGEVYDTEIIANAVLKNKTTLPYHIKTLDITADYLDLDNIFNSLSTVSMRTVLNTNSNNTININEKFSQIPVLIDKGIITAKKILIQDFPATDFVAKLSQDTDNILKVSDVNFKLAQGNIKAKGLYNFNTNVLEGNCEVKGVDANQFSQIFLNLKNQIYGNLDGNVSFNTIGTTPLERIENLNGKINFNITEGKMPKLGSLEYLLRAANLIKSGITGFTINNMIDLLNPVKTGDFSLITGNMFLENGKAQNIEISSTGKNLSLYITGEADIVNQNAQMIVLGRLSKKLSTILGPIGNTSLNTLFNFIPGISISENENQIIKELNKIPFLDLPDNKDYRFFQATIDGDLNSEQFVQTFKWVE